MSRRDIPSAKETSLDEAVSRFSSDLARKLKVERAGSNRMNDYADAVRQAAEYLQGAVRGIGVPWGPIYLHGPDHAGRALAAAEQIVKRLKEPLNACEFFVLGVSAILHDVGMTAPLPPSLHDVCVDEDERWRQRRERHGEATAEIISACIGPRLQAVSQTRARCVPQVLTSHLHGALRWGFALHLDEIRRQKGGGTGVGRYATLAGVLLLADELDITCARARPERNRYHEFRTSLTRAHWWKHWNVADAEMDGGVLRASICLDEQCLPGADEFAEWTKGKLEHQLRTLRDRLDPDGTSPLWRLELSMVRVSEVWWKGDLPELTRDVLGAAQKARLAIPGQRVRRVIDGERPIERIPDPHSISTRRLSSDRQSPGEYTTFADRDTTYVPSRRDGYTLSIRRTCR